ncbi:MAG: cob(I)yrinic acid a,c-diamide adenosyltransferase [Candidatus Aenigmatarchaeota archaeon]
MYAGDSGETGLADGSRISKDSLRMEAVGVIDELNSYIGLAISFIDDEEINGILEDVQKELFELGSDLSTPQEDRTKLSYNIPAIRAEHVNRIEKIINQFEMELKPLKKFILPQGEKGATYLHVARSICRRAERLVVALRKKDTVNEQIQIYLNRLSSLLFALARLVNQRKGFQEKEWSG